MDHQKHHPVPVLKLPIPPKRPRKLTAAQLKVIKARLERQ